MKKILVSLASTILATCFFLPQDLQGQSTNKADPKERFKTEIKKGATIAQRAKQLRATNKGFAKAYAEMLKRGGKPLFEEAGVSVIAHDSQRSTFTKVSTAAQELSEGDYEMTFFPFDTGNDAVWEGTIYVRGPVSEGTWAVSMSTTHEDISEAEIYYENFYSAEGIEIEPVAKPPEGEFLAKARFGATSEGAPKAMVYQRFQSWLNCVNRACYTAMRVCIWTGPFYFICFNTWCLNAMLSCLPPIGI